MSMAGLELLPRDLACAVHVQLVEEPVHGLDVGLLVLGPLLDHGLQISLRGVLGS